MAYVFKLPPTVTDQIMRYAIGYPSDRIKDMMARVERIECTLQDDDSDHECIQIYVKWSEFTGPWRNCENVLIRKMLTVSS